MILSDLDKKRLVEAARAATAKAFLTSPGGTSYGAAVLSLGGEVYSAGQYSSWNHVTNVHAEQAALIMATMNDDPDVVALAVASTADEPVTRPCGICRQVMKEHADRTGRDFWVLMAHRHDPGFDTATVSELLPLSWSARTSPDAAATCIGGDYRLAEINPRSATDIIPQVGDHVVLVDGSVAMVWDNQFDDGINLVKIKYAPRDDRGRRKVAHSFTEPFRYQRELQELGWARHTLVGEAAAIGPDDISGWFPTKPLRDIGDHLPNPLPEILMTAGVNLDAIRVTGSRAYGLERSGSDWDLVLSEPPERIKVVRDRLLDAVAAGHIGIPSNSGTWRLLDRLFPGGRAAIVAERRFIDTVLSGEKSVA